MQGEAAGQAPSCVGAHEVRFVVPRRWGWNPNGAGSAGSCSATSVRSALSAVSVSSRVRTAPISAMHRASCSGSSPMTIAQDVMDETHPALDPAHRPREFDRVAAQLIGRGGQTRGLLGVGHHRFEGVELARQPCGQTVRQQAEGGVAVATVPASNLCPARGLARVGAVACERTAPVGVIRAALEPCITPRLGTNVFLAGKPRLVAKLHRPWPGGVRPPCGPTPLSLKGRRDYGGDHRGAKR